MSNSTSSSVFAEAAFEATLLWLSNQNDACLQTLEKLESSGTTDIKVQHNACIAEFYTQSVPDWTKLLKRLIELKVQHLSQPSHHTEHTYFDTDSALIDLNCAIAHYHLQEYTDAVGILEPLYDSAESLPSGAVLRLCFLLLDIYLKCDQPSKAAVVLAFTEKASTYLFQDYVKGQQPPRTAGGDPATSAASSSSSSTTPTNGHGTPDDTSPSPSPNPTAPATAAPAAPVDPSPLPRISKINCAALKQARAQLQDVPTTTTTAAEFKALVRLCRVRVYLATRNHKAAKRELRALLASSPACVDAELFRADLEIGRGHLKKAQKLLGGLMQGGEEGALPKAPLMNAMGVLHHHLGKHRTAGLYFAKALEDCGGADQEDDKWSPQAYGVLYNWGLQHLLLGNFPLAFKCFQQAGLRYHHQPLLWLRIAESALGTVAMLQEHPPLPAVATSAGAAEAKSKGGQAKGKQGAGKGQAVEVKGVLALSVEEVFGPCSHAQVPPGGTFNTLPHSETLAPLLTPQPRTDSPSAPPSKPESLPLVQYAIDCLEGALQLLDTCQPDPGVLVADSPTAPHDHGSPHGLEGEGEGSGRDFGNGVSSPSPASPSRRGDPFPTAADEPADWTRHTVLANLAYARLTLKHHKKALAAAEQLLALQPQAPAHLLVLGHCYAAEAHCLQPKQSEAALTHLRSALSIQDKDTPSPREALPSTSATAATTSASRADEDASKEHYPLGNAAGISALLGTAGRCTLYVNLAAAYVDMGDFEGAQKSVECALQADPLSREATVMAAYVALAKGDTDRAMGIITGKAGPAV